MKTEDSKTSLEAAKGDKQTGLIRIDMPFLIRIMEVCREQVKDDGTLHRLAERIGRAGRNNRPVTMEVYEEVMGVPESRRTKKVAPEPEKKVPPKIKTDTPTATQSKAVPKSVPKTPQKPMPTTTTTKPAFPVAKSKVSK